MDSETRFLGKWTVFDLNESGNFLDELVKLVRPVLGLWNQGNVLDHANNTLVVECPVLGRGAIGALCGDHSECILEGKM